MKKSCFQCKDVFPLTREHFHKNKSAKDGYSTLCKTCAKSRAANWNIQNREKRNKRLRYKYSPEQLDRQNKTNRFKTYGVSPSCYERMLEAQGEACAVCQTDFASLKVSPHIDHCHHTGIVRGLLCHRCNVAMGGLE